MHINITSGEVMTDVKKTHHPFAEAASNTLWAILLSDVGKISAQDGSGRCVPVPPGCWGSALALERFVHEPGSARQGGAGEGGCSSLCPSWIPLEKGLQEGRMAGRSSSWQGESAVSGPWSSSWWILPGKVSGGAEHWAQLSPSTRYLAVPHSVLQFLVSC